MLAEVKAYEHMVTFNSNQYVRVIAEPLQRTSNQSPYTEGVLAYTENETITARIGFGEGGATAAIYTDQNGEESLSFKKGN